MKIVGLIQARMGSTRLPGKVLKKIVGKPMIELLLKRLSKSDELDEIRKDKAEKRGKFNSNLFLIDAEKNE